MRLVIAIDGDLLVPPDAMRGMPGQREEIARVVAGLGQLLRQGHTAAIVHGNAPQIGYVLLRSEAASHVMHPLPLDICGSDTQGATGYLLQQAIQNWFTEHALETEVASVITQVVVDVAEAANAPLRGIGPFYDPERARAYATARNWRFVLLPGQGHRRAVPALKPKAVVEVKTIRWLLEQGAVVVCAGGGGIPVRQLPSGARQGVEAVVDKTFTAALLATELEAETLIFVSQRDRLAPLLNWCQSSGHPYQPVHAVAEFSGAAEALGDDLYTKVLAGQQFLEHGGARVVFCPPDAVSLLPSETDGFVIARTPAGAPA